jgi:dTMP kinase
LDLEVVRRIIDLAVGDTRPDLTLLLWVPPEVASERLRSRQATLPFLRDRIEEANREFFERVARGYERIAAAEPQRIRKIDATGDIETVRQAVWREVEQVLPPRPVGVGVARG